MIERKTNHNGNKEASKLRTNLTYGYSQGQTVPNSTHSLTLFCITFQTKEEGEEEEAAKLPRKKYTYTHALDLSATTD